MTDLPLDYIAGLFDGEGWFSITRTKHGRHKREYQFQCHAGLVIREKFILDQICARFGGTVREQKRYSDNHSPTYRWRITGNNAQHFAQELKNHLRLKRLQAIVISQFQYAKSDVQNRPIDDWQYSRYEEYYNDLRLLNKRGIGKSEFKTYLEWKNFNMEIR